MELYLEESVFPLTSQFDILSWWKNNQGKYPILAKIARDFLAIHVSTIAYESTFSTGDRHLISYRSRLHPSIVEALVCTQNWFWLEQNLKDIDNLFIRIKWICCIIFVINLSLIGSLVYYVYDLYI